MVVDAYSTIQNIILFSKNAFWPLQWKKSYVDKTFLIQSRKIYEKMHLPDIELTLKLQSPFFKVKLFTFTITFYLHLF